jgi:hypothetical protein
MLPLYSCFVVSWNETWEMRGRVEKPEGAHDAAKNELGHFIEGRINLHNILTIQWTKIKEMTWLHEVRACKY